MPRCGAFRPNVHFWVLTDCVTDCLVQFPPLQQLSFIWNSHRKNVVVGRVAGRAGAMRAIAPSMPPRACPRQGKSLSSFVCGANYLGHIPAQARRQCLRLRHEMSAWVSGGLARAEVWRHAWGDGAHCPCAVRHAASDIFSPMAFTDEAQLFQRGGQAGSHADRARNFISAQEKILLNPPLGVAFIVNSEPHTQPTKHS